jgi:hypothetical protein
MRDFYQGEGRRAHVVDESSYLSDQLGSQECCEVYACVEWYGGHD